MWCPPSDFFPEQGISLVAKQEWYHYAFRWHEKFSSLKHELAHTLYLYGEALSEYRDQEDYDSAHDSFASLNDDDVIAWILPPHKANLAELGNLDRGLRHNELVLRRFQNHETNTVFEYLNHPGLCKIGWTIYSDKSTTLDVSCPISVMIYTALSSLWIW